MKKVNPAIVIVFSLLFSFIAVPAHSTLVTEFYTGSITRISLSENLFTYQSNINDLMIGDLVDGFYSYEVSPDPGTPDTIDFYFDIPGLGRIERNASPVNSTIEYAVTGYPPEVQIKMIRGDLLPGLLFDDQSLYHQPRMTPQWNLSVDVYETYAEGHIYSWFSIEPLSEFAFYRVDFYLQNNQVPEPGSALLFGAGLLVAVGVRRKNVR